MKTKAYTVYYCDVCHKIDFKAQNAAVVNKPPLCHQQQSIVIGHVTKAIR